MGNLPKQEILHFGPYRNEYQIKFAPYILPMNSKVT